MDISDQKKESTMDISQVTDHSSSLSGQPPYEVFLSFRGADMRRGFADFLYTMLIDVGISVFRNEEELERGKIIYPQLIQAIRQSKISIPIISKEYASSKSCLMELEQMVECMDNKNGIIIPIFYYVYPSDVCNCSGPFERALDELQKRALRRIGDLKGHYLSEKSDENHGEVIKQIVRQVQQKLEKKDLIVPEQLVGVDSHVQGIMAKLKVDYRNGQAVQIGDTSVKVLGIYGIPGVGKTVLAKYVYNQLHHLVDACSFLGEIQDKINCHGIVSVQNRLISDLDEGNAKKFDRSEEALSHIRKKFRTMKVLVLLDDIYNNEQFSALVGELDGLSPGSRVILTSQTQDVLRNIDGAESFILEPMKQDEALKLFCRHAFGTDSPHQEFEKLSTDIVAATGWLPLALEVTGSSLFLVKSKKAWMETLTALEVAPHKLVQAVLEKSYTNLDMFQRQIFLDIACFFIGMDKRIPYYMWDDCKYSPSRAIRALHARSLVQIGEDKELLMHDILKKFGREIVKNENRYEPSKRSRLCDHEEALHVLKRRKGTEKVQALGLEFGDGFKGNISFECDQFDGLQNLRFLKLDRADIRGNFGDRLSSLRWLDWQGCPKVFDDHLILTWQNLVILDLSGSEVHGDWRGWELLVQARKLKVLKLTGCVQLTVTPEFPASMELERLILEGCSNLAVIDPSFGNMMKLVSLNMKQCSLLRELPDLSPMRDLKELVIDGTSVSWIDFREGSMGKLKTLSARDCKSLTQISHSIGYLKSLKYLALDGSGIHTLPEAIGSLEELRTLSLKNCQRLSDLPNGIGQLRSLQFLDLSDTVIQELPASVKGLKAMKVLKMRGTFIQEFPEPILNLEKLEEIDFSLCQRLGGEIHFDIWRLSSLAILKLSATQISGLPPSMSKLSRLRELHIFRCSNLQSLPELPSSLINVLGSDGKLIKQIGSAVPQKLKDEEPIVLKRLVGVDPHVQGIMAKLEVDYRNGQAVEIGDTNKKVLGIYGIPGVGKTVLAKYVYNQLYHLFDACSFLGEIQKEIEHHGVLSVQDRLISDLHKGNGPKFDCSDKALIYIQNRFCTVKVLLLLDDVNGEEQLSTLVGKLDWLGPGSKVILTSQRQDVLGNVNGAESYVLGPMKQDDALKLFCWHAFGTDSPHEEFENLSKDIVAATGGLPLALTVAGSSLFLVKSKKAWRETLTALEVAPHKRVQAALEKTYSNLDENERQIFLDIACFFIGMDKRIPYYMWDDCKYSPSRSIRALHARSLIEIGEDKELLMHEILKKFGQEIVKNENRYEPFKRSRLCDHEEALDVLKGRKGTEKVQALGLEFADRSEGNISFECDQFDGLQNLRFLKLDRADIQGNLKDRLSNLRWLDWQGCPKIFDDQSLNLLDWQVCPKIFDDQSLNLNVQNLVILDLSRSQVDTDWGGWKVLVEARKLKVLKLTGCVRLVATPKFPASMELERLILEGCSNLAVIHPSFRNLTKLVSLNMKQCCFLRELQDLGPMRDLKELVIDGTFVSRIDFREDSMGKLKTLCARDCKSLTQISRSIGYLKSLKNLALDGSGICTLPESIESLEQLKKLSLNNCRSLYNLPDGIGKLRSLQFLDLSDTLIGELPPSVKDLKDMKVLRMRFTFMEEFPEAILNLGKLEEIDFSFCRSLEGRIPDDIWRLSSLAILKLSHTRISGLPPSISRLSHLRELDISKCDNLESLPKLPSILINVLGDSSN